MPVLLLGNTACRGSLLDSGKYTDLTIICGRDRYAVHKAIVCTQSRFFAAACDGPFTEAQTGEIKLDDDHPIAVKMMINYLYCGTYEPATTFTLDDNSGVSTIEQLSSMLESEIEYLGANPNKKRRGMFKGEPLVSTPPTAQSQQQDLGFPCSGPNASSSNSHQPPMSKLVLHAKVYALGEKYEIKDMKDLALQKFKQDTKGGHTVGSLTEAAREAYSSTIDEDRGMRDAVVNIVLMAPCLLEEEMFRDLVRETELGLDLALHFTRDKRGRKRKRN
ncbi:unnamed protein product [Fusarium equiseti]|uniref:BTB domain-containing protein n=1 Tax=Fusarium equiseti TaxID=61235 RepID=A0A8J2NFC2_FUSEQ|nr:unnamed protein product [Fusarium equiseti]